MDDNSKYKLNSILGIVFGLSLIIDETIRRFNDWGHWSRWMDDYAFGMILIVSAALTLKNKRFGPKLLIGAWGLCVGLLYGSFFSKVVSQQNILQSNIEYNLLVNLIGIVFGISLIGFVWVLLIGAKSNC